MGYWYFPLRIIFRMQYFIIQFEFNIPITVTKYTQNLIFGSSTSPKLKKIYYLFENTLLTKTLPNIIILLLKYV